MTTTISRVSLVDVASWAYRLMLASCLALLAWFAWSRLKIDAAGITLLLAFGLITIALARARRKARERFIQQAALPQFLKSKLREAYPHLSGKEAELAEQGLRHFFLACLHNKGRFTAMPSQAVDLLWHEFILHTQAYQVWCKQGLGYFLHHTPAQVLGKSAKRNDGLRRVWHWACQQEQIDPRSPAYLPVLFAIDNRLRIPDGFHYAPDCRSAKTKVDPQRNGGCGGGAHCGTSFSDGSYSGSSADFGGAESSGSDGGDGGCGGGCGGGD
jgi:hypothetical protein